jgi:hypothetical protein
LGLAESKRKEIRRHESEERSQYETGTRFDKPKLKVDSMGNLGLRFVLSTQRNSSLPSNLKVKVNRPVISRVVKSTGGW